MHTIATAAAAVGRNKTAILRAIKAGKISVAKDENGEWQIDPAELHRIYPLLRSASICLVGDAAPILPLRTRSDSIRCFASLRS